LITDVQLKDSYQDFADFPSYYQDPEKNLTNVEVGKIREKVISSLKRKIQSLIR